MHAKVARTLVFAVLQVEQLKELESEKEKLKEDAAEKRRQKALRNSTTNSTTKPATHDPQQPSAGEHAASQQDQKEQEAKASGEHEEIPAPKQTLRSVAIPVNEDRNGAQQHSEYTARSPLSSGGAASFISGYMHFRKGEKCP